MTEVRKKTYLKLDGKNVKVKKDLSGVPKRFKSIGVSLAFFTDQSGGSIFNSDDSLVDDYWRKDDPFDRILSGKTPLRQQNMLLRSVRADYNRDSSIDCSPLLAHSSRTGSYCGVQDEKKNRRNRSPELPRKKKGTTKVDSNKKQPASALVRSPPKFFRTDATPLNLEYTSDSFLCSCVILHSADKNNLMQACHSVITEEERVSQPSPNLDFSEFCDTYDVQPTSTPLSSFVQHEICDEIELENLHNSKPKRMSTLKPKRLTYCESLKRTAIRNRSVKNIKLSCDVEGARTAEKKNEASPRSVGSMISERLPSCSKEFESGAISTIRSHSVFEESSIVNADTNCIDAMSLHNGSIEYSPACSIPSHQYSEFTKSSIGYTESTSNIATNPTSIVSPSKEQTHPVPRSIQRSSASLISTNNVYDDDSNCDTPCLVVAPLNEEENLASNNYESLNSTADQEIENLNSLTANISITNDLDGRLNDTSETARATKQAVCASCRTSSCSTKISANVGEEIANEIDDLNLQTAISLRHLDTDDVLVRSARGVLDKTDDNTTDILASTVLTVTQRRGKNQKPVRNIEKSKTLRKNRKDDSNLMKSSFVSRRTRRQLKSRYVSINELRYSKNNDHFIASPENGEKRYDRRLALPSEDDGIDSNHSFEEVHASSPIRVAKQLAISPLILRNNALKRHGECVEIDNILTTRKPTSKQRSSSVESTRSKIHKSHGKEDESIIFDPVLSISEASNVSEIDNSDQSVRSSPVLRNKRRFFPFAVAKNGGTEFAENTRSLLHSSPRVLEEIERLPAKTRTIRKTKSKQRSQKRIAAKTDKITRTEDKKTTGNTNSSQQSSRKTSHARTEVLDSMDHSLSLSREKQRSSTTYNRELSTIGMNNISAKDDLICQLDPEKLKTLQKNCKTEDSDLMQLLISRRTRRQLKSCHVFIHKLRYSKNNDKLIGLQENRKKRHDRSLVLPFEDDEIDSNHSVEDHAMTPIRVANQLAKSPLILRNNAFKRHGECVSNENDGNTLTTRKIKSKQRSSSVKSTRSMTKKSLGKEDESIIFDPVLSVSGASIVSEIDNSDQSVRSSPVLQNKRHVVPLKSIRKNPDRLIPQDDNDTFPSRIANQLARSSLILQNIGLKSGTKCTEEVSNAFDSNMSGDVNTLATRKTRSRQRPMFLAEGEEFSHTNSDPVSISETCNIPALKKRCFGVLKPIVINDTKESDCSDFHSHSRLLDCAMIEEKASDSQEDRTTIRFDNLDITNTVDVNGSLRTYDQFDILNILLNSSKPKNGTNQIEKTTNSGINNSERSEFVEELSITENVRPEFSEKTRSLLHSSLDVLGEIEKTRTIRKTKSKQRSQKTSAANTYESTRAGDKKTAGKTNSSQQSSRKTSRARTMVLSSIDDRVSLSSEKQSSSTTYNPEISTIGLSKISATDDLVCQLDSDIQNRNFVRRKTSEEAQSNKKFTINEKRSVENNITTENINVNDLSPPTSATQSANRTKKVHIHLSTPIKKQSSFSSSRSQRNIGTQSSSEEPQASAKPSKTKQTSKRQIPTRTQRRAISEQPKSQKENSVLKEIQNNLERPLRKRKFDIKMKSKPIIEKQLQNSMKNSKQKKVNEMECVEKFLEDTELSRKLTSIENGPEIMESTNQRAFRTTRNFNAVIRSRETNGVNRSRNQSSGNSNIVQNRKQSDITRYSRIRGNSKHPDSTIKHFEMSICPETEDHSSGAIARRHSRRQDSMVENIKMANCHETETGDQSSGTNAQNKSRSNSKLENSAEKNIQMTISSEDQSSQSIGEQSEIYRTKRTTRLNTRLQNDSLIDLTTTEDRVINLDSKKQVYPVSRQTRNERSLRLSRKTSGRRKTRMQSSQTPFTDVIVIEDTEQDPSPLRATESAETLDIRNKGKNSAIQTVCDRQLRVQILKCDNPLPVKLPLLKNVDPPENEKAAISDIVSIPQVRLKRLKLDHGRNATKNRKVQINPEITMISPAVYHDSATASQNSTLSNQIHELSSFSQNKTITSVTTRPSLNESIDRNDFINAITKYANDNSYKMNLMSRLNKSLRNKSHIQNRTSSLHDSKDYSKNLSLNNSQVASQELSSLSFSLLGRTLYENEQYVIPDVSFVQQSNIVLPSGKWRKSLNRWRRCNSILLDKTTDENTTTNNSRSNQQQQLQTTRNSSFMLLSHPLKEHSGNVLQENLNPSSTTNVISSCSSVKCKNASFVSTTLPSLILESIENDCDQRKDSTVLLLEPTDDGTPNLPSLSLLESAIGRNLQSSLSTFHQHQQKSVVVVDPPEIDTAKSRRTTSNSTCSNDFIFNETSSNETRHPYQHQLSVPLFRQPSLPRRRRTSVIERCQDLIAGHPVGDQLLFPEFVHIPYENSIRTQLSPRELLLRRCNQSEPIDFSTVYSDVVLQQCRKIGEGVYGEVYMNKTSRGEVVVLKIVPIEGPIEINGEAQKSYDQILPEIVIAMELSRLRDDKQFMTRGFVEINKVCCVQGRYPEHLVDLWELYRDNSGTENDHPEVFPDDQLYIVFEQTYGGQDLEAFTFQNALQSYSAFVQTALTLAIAEQKYQFEHRDLHWGNILLAPTDDEHIAFRVNGEEIKIASHGVKVTIIDFTLSRMIYDGCCLYNDLSHDNELFSATGDYQFDIYRFMKQRLKNQWTQFEPYTNILWLHYTIDKMISGARYRCSKSKKHRSAIHVMMQLRDDLLDYKSASDYVECLK